MSFAFNNNDLHNCTSQPTNPRRPEGPGPINLPPCRLPGDRVPAARACPPYRCS